MFDMSTRYFTYWYRHSIRARLFHLKDAFTPFRVHPTVHTSQEYAYRTVQLNLMKNKNI